MEVEGMGGKEEDSGRHAWGRGGWAVPQGTPIEEAGVRRLRVEGRQGTICSGRSRELPCWRFPYRLSVCHEISRPNKEFK